jgi:hypothetical protein
VTVELLIPSICSCLIIIPPQSVCEQCFQFESSKYTVCTGFSAHINLQKEQFETDRTKQYK